MRVAAVREAVEDFGIDGADDQPGGWQFIVMTDDAFGSGRRAVGAILPYHAIMRFEIGARAEFHIEC